MQTLENKLFNCLILEKNKENFSSNFHKIIKSVPKSIETYLDVFISDIQDYIWKSYKNGTSNYDWTNNRTEPVNHMLKSYTGMDALKHTQTNKKFKNWSLHRN